MKKFDLLGVKIDIVTLDEALKLVLSAIKEKKKVQIATVNNEFIVEAQRNERFMNVLNNSALSVADSTGVVWAINYLYKEKIPRIPGVDLVEAICRLSADQNLRVYLLGGEEGVALQAKNRLIRKYPGIHIVGARDGIKIPAGPPERLEHRSVGQGNLPVELLLEINHSKPDIIFVALGAPKQDIWIANNLKNLNPYVFLGIGGTLDYISGRTPRAPLFLRKIGLEWLFRLLIQPSRFPRIFRATIVFPYLVISSRLRRS